MAQPVSIVNPVEIVVTADKRIMFQTQTLAGTETLTGDFRVGAQHRLTFLCATQFTISLSDFDDANPQNPPLPGNLPTGERRRQFMPAKCPLTSVPPSPPSNGPVYQSTLVAPFTLALHVNPGAQFRGIHKYVVVVTLLDGSLVMIDPQIIVDH